jgi:hypothetical protein
LNEQNHDDNVDDNEQNRDDDVNDNVPNLHPNTNKPLGYELTCKKSQWHCINKTKTKIKLGCKEAIKQEAPFHQ